MDPEDIPLDLELQLKDKDIDAAFDKEKSTPSSKGGDKDSTTTPDSGSHKGVTSRPQSAFLQENEAISQNSGPHDFGNELLSEPREE